MNIKSKATLKKMQNKLRFRNYSEATIRTYTNYAEKFLLAFNKDVYHISVKQAEKYLVEFNYTSVSQQNQIISAVKFLYLNVVGRKLKTLNIVRPRKEKQLPKVIDATILAEKITGIQNLKHKAILSVGLSCGLRISEVIKLKWQDLDRQRGLIHIKNAKGNKDRYVKLSPELICILENYWYRFKSKEYVFNGHVGLQYSASSVQKIVKQYIHPKASYHLLRHAFATYAHEQGNDIAILAKSLGHNSVKTTMVYTHISNKSLQQIKTAI